MLRFLLLLATVLPPLTLYYDSYIYPKWIWAIVAVLVTMALYSLRRLGLIRGNLLFRQWAYMFTAIALYLCFIRPFENPSVLTLHLCLLIPFVYKECRHSNSLAQILVGGILLVSVALAKCRTGWICIAVYLLIALPKKKGHSLLAVSLITAMTFGLALFVKNDSSRGRWFICQNTISLIMKSPIKGYGYHGFRKNYMLQQGEYFAGHPDSEYAQLADDINHPLNEFLLAIVDYGIVGFLILVLLLTGPLLMQKSFRPVQYSLMGICVFSLFSYPLLYPLSWVVIGANWKSHVTIKGKRGAWITTVFCIVALIFVLRENVYYCRWGRVSHIASKGHPKAMMEYYEKLYPHFAHNTLFLYDYSIESFSADKYYQAITLAKECNKEMVSYDLTLLMGDILQQMHKHREALQHYQKAAQMCPVRFAPWAGMLEVYRCMGDTDSTDSIRRIILTKDIKIYSKEIDEIIKEAKFS
ncbi:MAG: O-antigen ligase family protein [Bacteroidaceae bacterium]|nr:O-antigen ligase family protein [Bacteroidaceae bacterium]